MALFQHTVEHALLALIALALIVGVGSLAFKQYLYGNR